MITKTNMFTSTHTPLVQNIPMRIRMNTIILMSMSTMTTGTNMAVISPR